MNRQLAVATLAICLTLGDEAWCDEVVIDGLVIEESSEEESGREIVERILRKDAERTRQHPTHTEPSLASVALVTGILLLYATRFGNLTTRDSLPLGVGTHSLVLLTTETSLERSISFVVHVPADYDQTKLQLSSDDPAEFEKQLKEAIHPSGRVLYGDSHSSAIYEDPHFTQDERFIYATLGDIKIATFDGGSGDLVFHVESAPADCDFSPTKYEKQKWLQVTRSCYRDLHEVPLVQFLAEMKPN
ncbi:MAG: hypothetical protein AAGL69_00530 [Pseudomonadota bacterium]